LHVFDAKWCKSRWADCGLSKTPFYTSYTSNCSSHWNLSHY
jgi:hypothetical protein